MAVRGYAQPSALDEAGLSLALAPALTPDGLAASPSFFHGFATHPLVLARGLVTLADITATRYFPLASTAMRDPVLTAHGDRLRAEVFSSCAGVHARLDLLGSGFDGGEIGHGTTNVDIGPATRTALSRVSRADLLHVDVGDDGLAVSSPQRTAVERPVDMPDRWVRSLGNTAEILRDLVPVLSVGAAPARAFVAALPASATRGGWVSVTRTGLRVAPRASGSAVFIAGTHRLTALKRMLPHIGGLTLYGPASGGEGASAVEVTLPDARLTLALTAGPTRGFSGEGALLDALAAPTVLEDAVLLSALLSFEPRLDVDRLARDADLAPAAVTDALAVLASSGRVGWDGHDAAWFHRELPDDPDRVARDNPRLVAARRIVAAGGVTRGPDPDTWHVVAASSEGGYLVRIGGGADRCACTWYLSHAGSRGPCKHVLAVQLHTQEAR